MNILIYRNQILQEVTTGAYFCDINNSTKGNSEENITMFSEENYIP